jgi:GNAT superfamily N-acetyltransferase
MALAAQALAPMIVVRPITPADKERWQVLWQGYLDFYKVILEASATESLWQRLNDDRVPLGGLVALDGGGQVIGILHYVTHQNTWNTGEICYLEDLYVDAAVRGSGAGRLLIDTLAEKAREEGWGRLYWMTDKSNDCARRLYDDVATLTPYVRYDYPL